MTTMATTLSSRHRGGFPLFLPPSMAWTAVFVPALCYCIFSRLMSSSWNRTLGPVATSHVILGDDTLHALHDVLFVQSHQNPSAQQSSLLQYPLYLVQSHGLENVVASLWKHDSELGRGYLLLSQDDACHASSNGGRIWRWEVGGGPIAIGKTLAMEGSGCRSGLWKSCTSSASQSNTGSGPLAIDFQGHDHASEGRLIVAEYGERRIVRVEEETNGARTPLILQLPTVVSSEPDPSWRRLDRPTHMIMTPFGDLLVLEHSSSGDDNDSARHAIYRLKEAIHVDPLSSAMHSRQAHRWENVTHADQNIRLQLAYQTGGQIGSMALDSTWTALYVITTKAGGGGDDEVWLVRLSILDEDEDEELQSMSDDTNGNKQGLWHGREKFVSNLSALLGTAANTTTPPRALAVDRKGTIFIGTLNQGIWILDATGAWLGMLPVDAPITSLTLGEDGYLYATTENQLLRIRVKNGPVVVPTNMLPKKKHGARHHT